MVRAWFYDNCEGDQRDEHKGDDVDLEGLKKMTGVVYHKVSEAKFAASLRSTVFHSSLSYTSPVDTELLGEDEEFKKIQTERGYDYSDTITCSKEKLPDYETKIKSFFEEHLHSDEEIRLIMDGSGYFDLRTAAGDRWVRVECVKGDLIIVPAGIYHRFTVDHKNYIKAMRLFQGEPVWTPLNRPQEDLPVRKAYLQSMVSSQQEP